MKRWGWISIFALLVLSAAAQQASAPVGTTSAAPAAAVQPISGTPGIALAKPVARTPVSADQVVDQIIEREHALMTYLKDRKPLVETYLQNLTPDPKLGSAPKEDHYFLARLDLGESVDRRDYLAKQPHFQDMLMGGFSRLFRIQYQPIGFSWMMFVDRQSFDRNHYDFRYVHREFIGDVRCMVFDVSPKKDTTYVITAQDEAGHTETAQVAVKVLR